MTAAADPEEIPSPPDFPVEKLTLDTLERQDKFAKDWLKWGRKNPNLIFKEHRVPTGILPKNYVGTLIDVKVGVGKRRVPDDLIYSQHSDLREKVARGNCVLVLERQENGSVVETQHIFLIFALKKFTGGLGDEDDSGTLSEWLQYFTKDIEQTQRVVSTEKVNGEAAHISCWNFLDITYFCLGSKNVHMLVRNLADVQLYNDSRFNFARQVSSTFFETYYSNPDIDNGKKEALIQFMYKNQYTLVAEIVQPEHQHVVNLSFLEHPELRFICWTTPSLASGGPNLCSLPIDEAIKKARDYGLKTVEYEVIPILENATVEIEKYIPKVRKDFNHEGRVLYFLDKDNNTIGVVKKKTAWYILLRALREKVARFENAKPASLEDTLTKIRARVLEIQKWLEFTEEIAEGWTKLSEGFAKWLHEVKAKHIRSNFPVIFSEYLNQDSEAQELYDELLRKFETKPTLN